MSKWRKIDDKPNRPTMAVLFARDLMLVDGASGEAISGKLLPYRDERMSLGFFDGQRWLYLGTAHYAFEDEDKSEWPTHYLPLKEPKK
jgi:hypothetical protein